MRYLLTALALLCSGTYSLHAQEQPNIVLILVDDMGFGDLSSFRELGSAHAARSDYHYPATPHLDQLAQQGLRLTQFYVGSPICSASRTAITTGRFPARSLINSYLNHREHNRRHQQRDWLDPSGNCIARLFQQAGYATGHFGKWHQGGGRDVGDAPLPADYGFDESLVSFEGLGDRILPPGKLSEQSEKLGRGTMTHVEKHEQTGIYVDRAIDFIERHKQQQFYLHLWLNDVHDAHNPAPGAAEKFASITSNAHEQRFFAVLTELDRQIGRLMARIDGLGLASETLICLTSDNGPTAWRHYYEQGHNPPGSTAGFRGRKWSLYEGGIRMPFIARWPGKIPAGGVDRSSLVCAVDLLPTFAALAGIDGRSAQDLDGENRVQVLLGQPAQRERPLFWDYGREDFYLKPADPPDVSPNLAIRTNQWKLLQNADATRLELYAVGQHGEIDEFNNVAGQHPEVARKLSDQLLAFRTSLPQLESD